MMARDAGLDSSHEVGGRGWSGQDAELYNYFRDYEPAIGRYLQSDPVGLRGGISTFGYVGGNPLNFADPTGEFAVAEGVIFIGGAAIAAVAMSTPAGKQSLRDAVQSASRQIEKFCRPDCEDVRERIDRAIGELRKRYVSMTADKNQTFLYNLFDRLGWFSHQDKYREWQRNLARNVALAKAMGCPYNPEADQWLTRSPPDSPAY